MHLWDHMGRLLFTKFVELIVVLFVVSLVSFLLLALVPGGNPAVRILGDQATPESIAELEAELGLDDPIIVRYFNWLGDVLQGDLGRSTDLNQEQRGLAYLLRGLSGLALEDVETARADLDRALGG